MVQTVRHLQVPLRVRNYFLLPMDVFKDKKKNLVSEKSCIHDYLDIFFYTFFHT